MSNDIKEQLENVHVIVQARNGALQTAEVYTDLAAALERYSSLSSDKQHIKTLLRTKAEIEDLDVRG